MGKILSTQQFTKTNWPTNGAIDQFFVAGTYTALTLASSYRVGWTTSGAAPTWVIRSAFARFDTSAIPDSATIEDVKVIWRITQTAGAANVSSWAITFNFSHDWIGTTLDGSAADYLGGGASPSVYTHQHVYGATLTPGIFTSASINSAGYDRINKTGYTDMRFTDNSAFTFGTDHSQLFTYSSVYPKLQVTWSVDVPNPPSVPHAGL